MLNKENNFLAKRAKLKILLNEPATFKQQLILWAKEYANVFCLLDSNDVSNNLLPNEFSYLMAVGTKAFINSDKNCLETFDAFQKQHQHDYLLGYFGYDIKNEIEPSLTSNNKEDIKFPNLFFFQPQLIFKVTNNELTISYFKTDFSANNIKNLFTSITNKPTEKLKKNNTIDFQGSIDKQTYIQQFNNIQKHIKNGDVYELNFCQYFKATNVDLDVCQTYLTLSSNTKAPFSCLFKLNDLYLISASPERYLKKKNNLIYSQPIKGTAKRELSEQTDEAQKIALQNKSKERSENIMIVDLVRNDLSKFAKKGSVKVDELCQVYTFKNIHQLVSTISCKINKKVSIKDIIAATFPMGSMTGAPKLKAMELIERYESNKRGIFSGSIGYFAPNQDFDFNVVIRSFFYDKHQQVLATAAGSAITFYANAEEEYKECLLKIEALKKSCVEN